jgi:hypothetical protein
VHRYLLTFAQVTEQGRNAGGAVEVSVVVRHGTRTTRTRPDEMAISAKKAPANMPAFGALVFEV